MSHKNILGLKNPVILASLISIYLNYNTVILFCAEIKEKNPHFGSSLLLANIGPNSHISPKIVNGSFAALFDNNDDVKVDFSKKLQQLKQDTKDSGIKLLSVQTNIYIY